MKTTSFTLGLIGGIIGIIASFLAMFIGGVGSAFEAEGSGSMIGLGISALFASILGIVGSALVKGKPKVGSILMLISAVWGVVSVSMFYIVSVVLLGIGGIMGLFIKNNNSQQKQAV
ncbi:DUF4064 domain-containing protein [Lentibacillus kimchii]|uniref:DUF4064 domain-containing protein n=1 Tax=Lentibacillus kimchii TaxID=1542911 RepID=A0ABW2UPP3_9BACI